MLAYEYHDDVRCKHCSYPKKAHGQKTNPHRPYACPAVEREPRFPFKVADRGDTATAHEMYAARLRRYWTVRKTTFEAI